MKYSKVNESVARQKFSKKKMLTIKQSGFYISKNNCYLGASPDGNILYLCVKKLLFI